MRAVRNSVFVAGAAIAFLVSSPAAAQNTSQAMLPAPSDVIQTCQSCHGLGGNSDVASTPRLNGQQAAYIVARLKRFSDITRGNPHAAFSMSESLYALSDSTRASIANYFATQPPANPKPGILAAEGRRIYENGIAAQDVIACKLCHGAQADGHDATPRLAGQHADYLKAQLRLFGVQFRENNLMHPNTTKMTDNEIDALASYLAND